MMNKGIKIMGQTIILNPTAENMIRGDLNDLYFKDLTEIDHNIQQKKYNINYNILLGDESFSVTLKKNLGSYIATGSQGSKLLILVPPFSEQCIIYIRKFNDADQQDSGKTTMLKAIMHQISSYK